MGRGVVLVAALLSAALASACTPSDPPAQSPTPAPSPTFSCSTSTVSDPCTAEKAQKEKEQAAAYASAQQAYRSFLAERNRIISAGGATSPTAKMRENAAGPYLSTVTGFLKTQRDARLRARGSLKIGLLEPMRGVHRTDSPASELTLRFCEDGRGISVLNEDGSVRNHGTLIGGRMYARLIDGRWRIWDTDDSQVEKCSEAN